MDAGDYKQRLDKLYEILAGIAEHASVQATFRCPYKNRHDQCTAAFGCRNKRKPKQEGDPPACASDDKLNYRGAWETQ